ncbi:MAG: hypothetical protein K6G80_12015 [Treponema sp.]|nr:hypothetical protein [Treponema sp.]
MSKKKLEKSLHKPFKFLGSAKQPPGIMENRNHKAGTMCLQCLHQLMQTLQRQFKASGCAQNNSVLLRSKSYKIAFRA